MATAQVLGMGDLLMGCKYCDDAYTQELVYPYRWGTATVVLMGCAKHVKEIFDVLTKVQLVRDKSDSNYVGSIGLPLDWRCPVCGLDQTDGVVRDSGITCRKGHESQ